MAFHGLIFLPGFLGSLSATSWLEPSWLAMSHGMLHSGTGHFLLKTKNKENVLVYKDNVTFFLFPDWEGQRTSHEQTPKAGRNMCSAASGVTNGRSKCYHVFRWSMVLPEKGGWNTTASGPEILQSLKKSLLLAFFLVYESLLGEDSFVNDVHLFLASYKCSPFSYGRRFQKAL